MTTRPLSEVMTDIRVTSLLIRGLSPMRSDYYTIAMAYIETIEALLDEAKEKLNKSRPAQNPSQE